MSDPGGFHPLRKTKKVLLSLRSRSSSDDRSDSENLGLEYKEALRLAKEKSRRGDDQGYNTGAISKSLARFPLQVFLTFFFHQVIQVLIKKELMQTSMRITNVERIKHFHLIPMQILIGIIMILMRKYIQIGLIEYK
jgi:hypothetical protein